MSSPLFATAPVAPSHRSPPVIVIGMPRSGSSFLSHVMSALDEWYVFDDLYLYRAAQAMGAKGPLTPVQLEELIDFLGWQLRARIRFESDFAKPNCSWEDVDRMCQALSETFAERSVEWHELLEEWLVRLALHHHRSRWGYKAPQDFMHMAELAHLFPGLRFVFIVRDPRATMASFKYVKGEDGHPGQYHPWVYARYWRLASEQVAVRAPELGVPLLRVRFEDLVSDPEAEAHRIGDFLGTQLCGALPEMGANTSFRRGARRPISPTESWICERINSETMPAHNYVLSGARPRMRDLPDLAWTTLRFLVYQAIRLVRDPAARRSVSSFVRTLLRS